MEYLIYANLFIIGILLIRYYKLNNELKELYDLVGKLAFVVKINCDKLEKKRKKK